MEQLRSTTWIHICGRSALISSLDSFSEQSVSCQRHQKTNTLSFCLCLLWPLRSSIRLHRAYKIPFWAKTVNSPWFRPRVLSVPANHPCISCPHISLDGNVSDMSATCRRHAKLLPILAKNACRSQHKLVIDTRFSCRGFPTIVSTKNLRTS